METIRPQSEMFQRNPEAHGAASVVRDLLEQLAPRDAVEALHKEALEGESYEAAAEALGATDSLIQFRKRIAKLPFSSFYEIAEAITNIERLPLPPEEKSKQRTVAVGLARERVQRMSPRVADLFHAVLADIEGVSYEPEFDEVREKIADLKNVEEQRSDLDILFSADTSWDMKANRIETRFVEVLGGFRSLDKRDGKEMDDDLRKWREEQLKSAPTNPPSRRHESKPGVDPMERLKEGERAHALWSIDPGYGGYYKEQSFSHWDAARQVWTSAEEYHYKPATLVPLAEKEKTTKKSFNVTMAASVMPGEWVTLPIPYTHGLHAVDAGGRRVELQEDQYGDIVVYVNSTDLIPVTIKVQLAPVKEKRFIAQSPESVVVPTMPSVFSLETDKKLDEVARMRGGNIAKADELLRYVFSRIRYLAPKDSAEAAQYNNLYATHPGGLAGAVDECRKGDCDVVNTYYAALCAKIGVPVRHCVGHSVKGADEKGVSSIHSGTGHGWSEVWNEKKKEWVRKDATPAGDPNLEDQEGSGGRGVVGDYGDAPAVRPSDEQLEELRKKLAEHKEQLSYTRDERQLAEATGIELKEARKIVKEINTAESARLSNGELMVDAMASLFAAIAQSRKKEQPAYTGPVRRREGGQNISEVVRHYIGVQAGESDPLSRERSIVERKEEKLLHGMDVYVVGDKSGSMASATEQSEPLWELQRRFEYLLFSSLYRFNRDLEKAHLPSDRGLDVRTMAISFRGQNIETDIDLDKPLSPRFTAEDKVRMWHSLTEQGGGNGDVAAIRYLYGKIKEEKEEMARQGIEDDRLRVVIAYSDGGYVGAEGEMRAWVEEMSKLGVVVVGLGLTKSAASVPVVMHNPPKSFGEIVSNLEELTIATAKHIVMQAIKLFPERAIENAQQIIEETINKFKIVK